jgi:DNA gyrase inhibitor GyrI
MAELEVYLVKLEPMRVASVHVVSRAPEHEAWEKLRVWAEPLGLLDDIESHPVFGFNNPSPSPARLKYGYEFWIKIDPDVTATGEIELKDFPGGVYAVTSCKLLGDPSGRDVPKTWRKLMKWVKSNKYPWRRTHELEKPRNPLASEEDWVLDLYLPVEERI